MSLRYEIWNDGKIHTVYRDEKGLFSSIKKKIVIVDWLTKDWVHRRSKPFDPNVRKIFI